MLIYQETKYYPQQYKMSPGSRYRDAGIPYFHVITLAGPAAEQNQQQEGIG